MNNNIDWQIVLKVIDSINEAYFDILEKVNPMSYHNDPYEYYMSGACSSYALILKNIFPEAIVYTSYKQGHVITQIGDSFYDVYGIVTDPSSYEAVPDEMLELCLMPFQKEDSKDNLLIAMLSEVGKEVLENLSLRL